MIPSAILVRLDARDQRRLREDFSCHQGSARFRFCRSGQCICEL